MEKYKSRYYKRLNDSTGTIKEESDSKFKLLYKYESDEELTSRSANAFHKFDYAYTDEIILDIDNKNNIEQAFKDTDKTVKYLSDKYNAKVNVYWSGLGGTHICIPLKEPLKLSLYDYGKKPNGDWKTKTVIAYELLLEELTNALNIEFDDSLKQGTRIIQLPNVKKNNDKGRTHKISIGNCRDLNKIRSYGKDNNNIVDPQEYDNLEFIEHMKELDKSDYIPTLDDKKTSKKKTKSNKQKIQTNKIDESIESVKISDEDLKLFVDVYNALLKENQNENRHKIGLWIASGLNGYLTLNQMKQVIDKLSDETDISDSQNYYNSFIDAFENDKEPENIGAIYNKLKTNEIGLFNDFKDILLKYQKINNQVRTKNNYESFKELLNEYDNDIEVLFDDKLITYRKNSKQLFKGVIYSLSSTIGLMSQIVNINAPSGSGKTEYIKTLNSIVPNFLMEGGGTAKSLYREDDYLFDKKSVYLGDWGLITDDEEKEAIIKIFRELMTDRETKYRITANNNEDKITFYLKANSLSLFITELYTKKYQFGLGEQLVNKSQNININDLDEKDIIDICVLREMGENDDEFRLMHKDYVSYIVKTQPKIVLSREIITELFETNMRAIEMDIAHYKTFCIYFGYDANDKANVVKYREYFEIEKLTKIEAEWLKKLEENFEKITVEEAGYEIPHEHIINSTTTTTKNDEKLFHYFTIKRLKSYLGSRIKNNKTLNESVDYLSDILNVLLKKGYVGYTFEEDFGKERIYYLIKEEDKD